MHMRFDAFRMHEGDRHEHLPRLPGGRRNFRIDSDVGPEFAAMLFELGPALTCTVREHGFGPRAIVLAYAISNTGVRVAYRGYGDSDDHTALHAAISKLISNDVAVRGLAPVRLRITQDSG
jgi:hypothetical protein